MSGATNGSTIAESVRESVAGTLDWDELESMLEGDTPRAVGRELGARLGRKYGAVVGRELGAVVAVDIRDRKGPRAILADVKQRFLELLRSLLRSADLASGLSRLRELGTTLDVSGGAVELLETVVPGEGDGAGENGAGESEAGAEESASEAPETDETEASETTDGDEVTDQDEAADGDGGGIAGVSAVDIDEMRAETYRELLEVMSYSDLQSIAKEVGVKANLGKEKMIDRIVEEFSERRG